MIFRRVPFKFKSCESSKTMGPCIVQIGNVYTDDGDYSHKATKFIQDKQGYDLGSMLFKPTLTSERQFRSFFDAKLSYFVGNNNASTEENSFAIKPYIAILGFKILTLLKLIVQQQWPWETISLQWMIDSDVKVEYTFTRVKDKNGELRITAHQTSLPYSPKQYQQLLDDQKLASTVNL